MVPVHHKNDCRRCGERTIFTDDNFLSEKYTRGNITFELRAENGQHCTCSHVTGCNCDLHSQAYTLLMCPKLTQYKTYKHYIPGSLKQWFPSASWVRGISMGGPIALWTKDYNGFGDVSCGPLQRLAWLKAVSHNGTCSRPSDVAGKSFRENYFKIDYLFYTTNIGGHWCLQSYFTSYCEKRLVIWTWI